MAQHLRHLSFLFASLWLVAQEPPPMPEPKPIGVPPIGALRPKTSAPAVGKPDLGKPEPTSGPPQPKKQEPTKPADFGHTLPPWPNGSTEAKDFPQQVPHVPNARIAAYSMSGGTAMAFYTCDASPQAVAGVYRDFARKGGWELVPFPGPPLEQEAILIARKDDWTLRVDASINPLTSQTEAFVLVLLKPLPPEPAGEAGKGKP
jgi:hypothetical protein